MTAEERSKKLMSQYEREDFNLPNAVENDIATAIREAVEEEREANAKIVESYPEPTCRVYQAGDFVEVAERIRQRKDQP